MLTPRQGLAAGLTAALLWAAAGAPATAAPIVITKVRDLYFGKCDNIGGATYIVDPAATPGPSACVGAHAARFDVTGDPSAKVQVTSSKNVTVTNGTDSVNVRTDQAPSGGNITLDANGELVIYMGGEFKVSGGGFTSTNPLSGSSTLSVNYKGGGP